MTVKLPEIGDVITVDWGRLLLALFTMRVIICIQTTAL